MQHRFTFLLTLFIVLATSVHLRLWASLDGDVLYALQATLPRVVDVPFSLLSLLGSAEITVLIFLPIVWFARTEQRIPLFVAFGLVAVLELGGKLLIAQPETPDELLRYAFRTGMPSGKLGTGFSFPSGHMARTTFLVIILMQMISTSRWNAVSRKLGYATLIIIAGLMFISRIYLADHWLTDVLGGALLGGACAVLALQWNAKSFNRLVRKFFDRDVSWGS
jgi:membrane-associated phospholipid phosphatase